MEITPIYVLSQIITIIYFGLLNISYLVKDRTKILTSNMFAHIGQILAMALLKGYTGAAMAVVMLIRDVALLIIERKELKNKKTIDLAILIITILLIISLTVITYAGPLSLLSVGATLVLSFAVWQKNVKTYKLLGIIGGILWLAYNIFIFSIMGIILETTVVISSTIGFINSNKKVKK